MQHESGLEGTVQVGQRNAPSMEVLEVLLEAVPAFHKSSANATDCLWPQFQRPIFKGVRNVFI